ncbi:MAG: PAS domain-containing sensor histidine kinase [Clostridia bacterium]|nr:PAS domain-containing sensor histidine kinase [Clostridia bacterium]
MTKRIFRSICVVSLAVLLVSMVLVIGALYSYFTVTQQNQMRTQLELATQAVENEGAAYFNGLAPEGYRVTWIAADGTVLADTAADVAGMENHLDREEIREALEMGRGESVRYSDTLTERQLYAAARLTDGSVVRVSGTVLSLFTLIMGISQEIAITVAVALLLAFLLALYESRRLMRPLNELSLDDLPDDPPCEYEELKPLLRRLSSQQSQLRGHAAALRRRQDEFRAMTDGLSDGLILFNERGTVISINRMAAILVTSSGPMGADSAKPTYAVGRSVSDLTPALGLESLLYAAEKTGTADSTVRLHNLSYRLHAAPVTSDGRTVGYVIHIVNMTEKEQNEQMRREFTANVSHELKTPIHSIAGCSELLASGMVAPEDVPQFARQIYAESHRMIRLVEDIIKLSHLDEGAQDMQMTDVDLRGLAENAIQSLRTEAEMAEVTLILEGSGDATVHGIPQQLGGIIVNLCDNAIKYNRKGGTVTVTLEREQSTDGTFVVLTVKDTGIGIPEEHHGRIFERFYRVDKSHSKEVGGTGLGLSIVKHAVRLHHATIDLQSRVDVGTTVTVRFPAATEART